MEKNQILEKLENEINSFWNSLDRTKNCVEMLKPFLDFLDLITDERDVTFDGEGSYFGKQITINYNSQYNSRNPFQFEIAYDFEDKISIYTANNNGFWVPEYFVLIESHPDFEETKNKLNEFLKRIFGLF